MVCHKTGKRKKVILRRRNLQVLWTKKVSYSSNSHYDLPGEGDVIDPDYLVAIFQNCVLDPHSLVWKNASDLASDCERSVVSDGRDERDIAPWARKGYCAVERSVNQS